MFKSLRTRLLQFHEEVVESGFAKTLSKVFYTHRVATVVQMDLSDVGDLSLSDGTKKTSIVELQKVGLQKGELSFLTKSRFLKALTYLDKGYTGLALVKNIHMIADLWFVSKRSVENVCVHPDLELLGVTLEDTDVYMFDMYLEPRERGRNASTEFMGSCLLELKQRGYKKAYGYYFNDNIPALWVHRLLNWKELYQVVMQRTIFGRKAVRRANIEPVK